MKLLNNGSLVKEGYSFEEYEYHKSDIKGLKTRIKEWDYYHFINKDYGLCITVDNNSYMDLVSVTFIDFSKNYFFKTKHISIFLKEKSSCLHQAKKVTFMYQLKILKSKS